MAPDGFVEVSDHRPARWTGTVQLFVTRPASYDTLIDTSTLVDGAVHEYRFGPVMNEGARPAPNPC
ncbi:MAG: hypothetical protein AUI10_11580 [Actinobacteria bacterium 13_2_20CM_2_72_6]|nr:MAG: hypothetical protein AUI10_11580 [Actinobacteria bacterium 13_2_20CM_2_72_6]